jgi:hypothetical protein
MVMVRHWPVGSPRLRWMPDAWPRESRERYRIVVVRNGVQETVASTPTKEGIGTALVTLHSEGEFADARVGVLDTLAERHGWIVSPYETGGTR